MFIHDAVFFQGAVIPRSTEARGEYQAQVCARQGGRARYEVEAGMLRDMG